MKIALTCGDPAGIGPEIALLAARDVRARGLCEPVLVGPPQLWPDAREIPIVATEGGVVPIGHSSALGGKTAMRAIDWAIAAALRDEVAAVVTAPVSKTSLKLAGYDYPGQTEYFSHACGDVPVAMMLAGPKLRVVLVSTHLSLKDAIAGLSIDGIVRTAEIAHKGLGAHARLALCALNPHAGEEGMFGDEEARILTPAVRRCREAGIPIEGPFPADTLFVQAVAGRFDAVVVLYHDQGLIPLKLLHWDVGVNVTLGLPIIRTSPDHGTAFDIAGKGLARPTSMIAAVEQAIAFTRA